MSEMVKSQAGRYIRYAKIPINDVITKFLRPGLISITIKGVEYKVRGNSQRYHVFQKSIECVTCGLKANVAYIEGAKHNNPHINLYHKHENGGHTLFTKDHIISKAKGGTDTLDNYQTMCFNCNQKKGGN